MSRAESVAPYGGARERMREAFRDGEIPVGVYGLGKMGLPLAAAYAEVCGNVIGADADEAVVDGIDRGECHVEGEPGLDALVERLVADDALRATDNRTAAAEVLGLSRQSLYLKLRRHRLLPTEADAEPAS